MRRWSLIAAALLIPCLLLGAAPAGATHAPTWRSTIVTSARGGNVTEISCVSGANCTAAGLYGGASGSVFVIHQVKGVWSTAHILAGLPTAYSLTGLSCPSVGYCALSGFELSTSGDLWTGFVVSEIHGVWQKPDLLTPGSITYGDYIYAIACPTAGDCTAVGEDATSDYILTSTRGVWGAPQPVTAVTGVDPSTDLGPITNLACPSLGNCTAIGSYTSTTYLDPTADIPLVLPFTLDEVNGVWGEAESLTGVGTFTAGEANEMGSVTVPAAEVDTLSCGAPGDCVAGGEYSVPDRPTVLSYHAFVSNEINGVWGEPTAVTGVANVSDDGNAGVTSVSCSSATTCEAIGYYDLSHITHAFADEYLGSRWLPSTQVHLAVNRGHGFVPTALSCSAKGCVLLATQLRADPPDTDYFQDIANYPSPIIGFTASEIGGKWSVADTVPLTYKGKGEVTVPDTLACTKGGYCVEGGDFVYAQHVNKYKILVNSTQAYVQTATL